MCTLCPLAPNGDVCNGHGSCSVASYSDDPNGQPVCTCSGTWFGPECTKDSSGSGSSSTSSSSTGATTGTTTGSSSGGHTGEVVAVIAVVFVAVCGTIGAAMCMRMRRSSARRKKNANSSSGTAPLLPGDGVSLSPTGGRAAAAATTSVGNPPSGTAWGQSGSGSAGMYNPQPPTSSAGSFNPQPAAGGGSAGMYNPTGSGGMFNPAGVLPMGVSVVTPQTYGHYGATAAQQQQQAALLLMQQQQALLQAEQARAAQLARQREADAREAAEAAAAVAAVEAAERSGIYGTGAASAAGPSSTLPTPQVVSVSTGGGAGGGAGASSNPGAARGGVASTPVTAAELGSDTTSDWGHRHEIKWEELKGLTKLGQGSFGVVHKAVRCVRCGAGLWCGLGCAVVGYNKVTLVALA